MTDRDHSAFTRSLMLILCLGLIEKMPANAQTPETVNQSTMIFEGKIVRLHSASFAAVPASANTAVVNVIRVIEKPPAVALIAGQDITVALKDPSKFKVGTQATFYTQGWILGEGLAVREVGHQEHAGGVVPEAGQTEQTVAKQRQNQKDSVLQARLKKADMVVIGRVLSVRQAARDTGGKKFVTEHDPQWQEATIKVESAMKGAKEGDEIVVRFPGSEDVAYRGVPRFKSDQSGVYLLKKDSVTGLPRLVVGTATVDAYVAQSPLDCLTRADSTRVKRLMQQR